MVAPTGKRVKPGPPSKTMYAVLMTSFLVFSLGAGYMVAVMPEGSGWRLFSYHPFLMTCAFVGMFGGAAVTKKLGGYTNTKLHGILAWVGVFLSLGGVYAVYTHKENMGYAHLKTAHSKIGLGVIVICILLGMAGGVFLHPDFGIDKTNKTIRFAHKMASRVVLMLAWITAIYGLILLTTDSLTLAVYALPLLLLAPFTWF